MALLYLTLTTSPSLDDGEPDRSSAKRSTASSAFSSFESGDGNAAAAGEGFISFDDSWTKPRPEDIPDAAFPKVASPQRDSTSRTSRSSSTGKYTIGGDVSLEQLSLSLSADSDGKIRAGRRRRSRTPKVRTRTSSQPGDEKPRRTSLKDILFQSSSS